MNSFQNHSHLLRRSLLTVPADNQRALQKVPTLDCDAVIFDLEDSVSAERKPAARDNLHRIFTDQRPRGGEWIIRINSVSGPFAAADLDLVAHLKPDAVLVPKVEGSRDVQAVFEALEPASPRNGIALWAMIETPKGVLEAVSIASAANGPKCLVVGLNDLRKETGVAAAAGRTYLVPWLMQIVLAGRAHGVDVIDSVFNDFSDMEGFEADCMQGKAMGFSGKMLIHPSQIESANRNFGPSETEIADAAAIVAAYRDDKAGNLNVINLDGKMVERLHLTQAEALLARAEFIARRKRTP